MAAEAFESYFRAADLDRDGLVSGQEAVAFFRGSGLPQQVLAQIWNYADRRKSGFLQREEFFNALRLVTVAQTGRQLAPEIVQSALYGPAAAKIPAPRINIPAAVPQANSIPNALPSTRPQMSVPTTPQTSQVAGFTSNQTSGFRGQIGLQNSAVTLQASPLGGNAVRPSQAPQGAVMNPQQIPPGASLLRPSQPIPEPAPAPTVRSSSQKPPLGGSVALPYQASSAASNLSTDWFGGKGNSVSARSMPAPVTTGSVTNSNISLPQSSSLPSTMPTSVNPGSVSNSNLGLTQSSSLPSGGSTNLQTMPALLPVVGNSINPPNLFSAQQVPKENKALVNSGNGFPAVSSFGSDTFSAASQQRQPPQVSTNFAPNNTSSYTATLSVVGSQPSQQSQFDLLQAATPVLSGNSPVQQSPLPPQQKQFSALPNATASGEAGPRPPQIPNPAVPVASSVTSQIAPNISQDTSAWPKITQSDIQKYTIVFIKVDKDRDGKITGEEARNLFFSWRLPRDILKKVWDLSDQDKDGMLSFREFCIAVYLMERHRERRPLPDVVPTGIWSDGIILPSTGQFSASGPATQPTAGYAPQGIPGARPVMPPSSMKQPPRTPLSTIQDDSAQTETPKSQVPLLEKNLMDQLSKEEQSALESKFKEASEADKKVQELEKEIMESREKIEFYRTKMQELILYKSRVDNRLNEISERVSADKQEAQVLAQKYEDKCKKLGDVASKLTIEEATFREIQERKLEIYNSIVKLQKKEGSDDSLQERANKVQSDLEELMKTLSEQCKTYGLRAKPTTLLELPFGWQPGVLEAAAVWDEEWDTFGDEGFTIIKELTVEIEAPSRTEKESSAAEQDGKILNNEAEPSSSSEKQDNKGDKHPNDEKEEKIAVNEKSGDPSTPEKKIDSDSTAVEAKAELDKKSSGSSGHSNVDNHESKTHSTKSDMHDVSPQASESTSDREATELSFPGSKKTEEGSRSPASDHSSNPESLWGFSKGITNGTSTHDFFLGTEGLPPIRTGITSASVAPAKDQKPSFDSVPGTPLYNSIWSDTPSAASVSGRDHKPLFDSVPSTPVQNPIWAESPSAASIFGKEQRSFFDASVPSTPMSDSNRTDSPPGLFGKGQRSFFDSSVPSTPVYNSSGFSPKFSEAGDDRSFDSFNRFDSFSSQGNNLFGHQDNFSRFDSFNSSSSFGGEDKFSKFDAFDSTGDHGNNTFSRFDSFSSTADHNSNSFSRFDSFNSTADHGTTNFSRFDSFNSTADRGSTDPFARFDSFSSSADVGTKEGFLSFDSTDDHSKKDNITRFDSFRSSGDHSTGYSFDDKDPFGSGPFKSSESHSPTRHGTDKWSSF